MRLLRMIAILMIVLSFSERLGAQVATGTPRYGSFAGGPDAINLANLNVRLNAPIVQKPGRGVDFQYVVNYDNSIWTPVGMVGSQTWSPNTTYGWSVQTNTALTYVKAEETHGSCNDPSNPGQQLYDVWHFVSYTDEFGQSHPINLTVTSRDIDTSCTPDNNDDATRTLTDGSGLVVEVMPGSALVTKPNGTKILPVVNSGTGTSTITDGNGNYISASSGVFTDTLGINALTITGLGTSASPRVFTYPKVGGLTNLTVTVHYASFNIRTNFHCSGITDVSFPSVNLPTDITLPNGSMYTFTYEATPGFSGNVTGRIASVTYPTGATISYAYSGGGTGVNGITCSDGSAATLTRTTPDGTWQYAKALVSGISTTTVTAPHLTYDTAGSQNQTVIQFQGIYETERQVYQGSISGTALATIDTCYNSSSSPCTPTAITLPINRRTVITTLDATHKSEHDEQYNSLGFPTEVDDFDFASSPVASPLKKITTTYISNAFPATVTIKDGGGTPQSRTDYGYSQSTFSGGNCITNAPHHDNTNFGCSATGRANITSITTYTNPAAPSGGITKNFTYDNLGNLRSAQLNCCQQKTWTYTLSGSDYAYPESETRGSTITLTTSTIYDTSTGLPTSRTDENGIVTSYTYDDMFRIKIVTPGSNPAVNYSYNDFDNHASFTAWTAKVCQPVQGSDKNCEKNTFDSSGRPVLAQLMDASSVVYRGITTYYDEQGRAYATSNPTTGTPSKETKIALDALGRQVSVSAIDSGTTASSTTISYSNNLRTVSDAIGNQRVYTSDSLGRTVQVDEPDPSASNALNFHTTYTYNVFDQLTGVTQGSQTRTYTFDALGRLLKTITPEAGTVCFGTLSGSTCQSNGYDSFDNLLYRTDARGVVTNYLYDSLNRLTGISYPTVPSGVASMPNVCKANGSSTNNANVCFVYGTTSASYNNGRLIFKADPSGSESYTYDQFGNISQLSKVIGSTTYPTNYTYNYANQIAAIQYPSGRTITNNLDGLGRLSSVVGNLSGTNTTYASGFGYNDPQQLTGFLYGNNIFASLGYSSNRLQLNCLDYSTTNRGSTCTHDSTSKLSFQYSYGSAGSNIGQLAQITDNVDSGRKETFSYDSLYRLVSAYTQGSTGYPAWSLTWTYDRYGNRLEQKIVTGGAFGNCLKVSVITNRITEVCSGGGSFAYDAAGNMTNDGLNTLTYDGENRVTATTGMPGSGTYTYDGNGIRVKKVAGSNTTVFIYSGSRVIAEYQNGAAVGSPTNEYIYAGANKIAILNSGTVKYLHNDQLTSLRMRTDSSGNIADQRGHYPFGELWYTTTSGTPAQVFTAYFRDNESGNDYAIRRTYVNSLSRFSSPDIFHGSILDPQSLNKYSYSRNSPTNLIDPLGSRPLPPGMVFPAKRLPPIEPGALGAGGCGELEAVEGQEGCFISYSLGFYGGFQLSWGFSEELWSQELRFYYNTCDGGPPRICPELGPQPNRSPVRYEDFGVIQNVFGFIPEVNSAVSELKYVYGALPYDIQKNISIIDFVGDLADIVELVRALKDTLPGADQFLDTYEQFKRDVYDVFDRYYPNFDNSTFDTWLP